MHLDSHPRSLPTPAHPDFSRHDGLLDHELLRGSHVACVGTGGAAGVVANLVRSGIARVTVLDHDLVSPTNPTTQAHDAEHIGLPKVAALQRRLLAINPATVVTALPARYADIPDADRVDLWRAHVVLAMTDDFATQCAINRDAIATGTDTIFAICYIGCDAVEITATFPDTIASGGGCHRCHTKARYDAYETGFKNPSLIASHALAAEYLNSLLGLLVVSRLHERARSPLAIAQIAREFGARPCLISRMTPTFGTMPSEAFAELPAQAFTTRLFALDTPSDWTCPDCGTRGVVAPATEFQRPLANPGPGPTQERS